MTRREQYVQRKRRMLFRAARDHGGGFHGITGPTPTGHFGWRQTGRSFPIVKLGKLHLYVLKHWKPVAQPITPQSDPLYAWTVNPHDNDTPPSVAFTGLFALFLLSKPTWHQHYQIIGYFNRPIDRRPHKKGRRTGIERTLLGAAWRAFRGGYFPMWDPLQRHPNDEDGAAGAPPYSGPFPQSPRGGIVQ